MSTRIIKTWMSATIKIFAVLGFTGVIVAVDESTDNILVHGRLGRDDINRVLQEIVDAR